MRKSALTVPSAECASSSSESVENGTVSVELLAERARQVRHLGVAGDPARGPFPHLAGAEGGLAAVGERLFEERQIHAFKVASRL